MIARISSPVSTLSGRPRVVGVERHELDEAHLVRMLAREPRERQHLVLGEAAHRDGVDLDRVGLRERGERLEAREHPRQRVAARHLEEAVALERVDRDVEALDAGVDERRGVALEQEAVRRDREVLDARDRASIAASRGKSRRTSGSPPVRRTSCTPISRQQRDDAARSPRSVRTALALEPRQALGGHAVLAAEVAAVGDRDAHVADVAAVTVDEGFAHDGQATGRDELRRPPRRTPRCAGRRRPRCSAGTSAPCCGTA